MSLVGRSSEFNTGTLRFLDWWAIGEPELERSLSRSPGEEDGEEGCAEREGEGDRPDEDASLRFRDAEEEGGVLSGNVFAESPDELEESPEDGTAEGRGASEVDGVASREGEPETRGTTPVEVEGTRVGVDDAAAFRAARARASTCSARRVLHSDWMPIGG